MQIGYGHNQHQQKQSGRGTIGTIIRIGVFLAVIAVLAQAVEVLYRFYDLKNQAGYLIRSAELEPDSELRKKILAVTKRAGIECTEQDIVVDRSGGRVRLEFWYRHPVGVPFTSSKWKVSTVPLHLTVERRLVS